MATLRKPFLLLAILLIGVVVLIEIGSGSFIKGVQPSDDEIKATVTEQSFKDPDVDPPPLTLSARQTVIAERVEKVKTTFEEEGAQPGIGIPFMALVDGIVLFTVALMGTTLILKQSTQARLQGCVTLIFSVLLVLLSIVLLIVGITFVFYLLGLLGSIFGIVVYIALFAFFNKGGALATLGILMALKLGFGASMLAAEQGFLKNKGLLLLVLTSLLANLILAFLIALVPLFLDSITDAVGGIIMSILALIWAIIMLIGGIIGTLKALQPS
jgi:hypothetical protein